MSTQLPDYVVPAQTAEDLLVFPRQLDLSGKRRRRLLHPRKQVNQPWRSPDWYQEHAVGECLSDIASAQGVPAHVLQSWGYIFGFESEPRVFDLQLQEEN